MDTKKQKLIPLRDFVYLCIIVGIILIFSLSIVFGDSPRAGENLSFASTMVSIVLAVIAIVITLVDVAGQKQSIMQLQDTVNILNKSVEEAKSLTDRTSAQYSAVSDLKDELIAKMAETVEWREKVLEQLNVVAESNSKEEDGKQLVELEDVQKALSNFELKVPKLNKNWEYIDYESLNKSNKYSVTLKSKKEMDALTLVKHITNLPFKKQLKHLKVNSVDHTWKSEDGSTRQLTVDFDSLSNQGEVFSVEGASLTFRLSLTFAEPIEREEVYGTLRIYGENIYRVTSLRRTLDVF